jgi:hypothetical protein
MGKYTALVEDHLILPARVRLPPVHERRLAALAANVPAPVPIRLLIDTGSRRTTLTPGIVRHLQPASGGEALVTTATSSIETDLVWVCLEFPEAGLASYCPVLVARVPMPPQLSQFHGLLGRDLLARLELFEYHGRRRRYSLRDRPGWLAWLRERL